ncbi:hypothetical protein JCM11251_005856 [Rhodosporidiobolus azoricus]
MFSSTVSSVTSFFRTKSSLKKARKASRGSGGSSTSKANTSAPNTRKSVFFCNATPSLTFPILVDGLTEASPPSPTRSASSISFEEERINSPSSTSVYDRTLRQKYPIRRSSTLKSVSSTHSTPSSTSSSGYTSPRLPKADSSPLRRNSRAANMSSSGVESNTPGVIPFRSGCIADTLPSHLRSKKPILHPSSGHLPCPTSNTAPPTPCLPTVSSRAEMQEALLREREPINPYRISLLPFSLASLCLGTTRHAQRL